MKTMYGITFEQLHNSSSEELNKLLMAGAMDVMNKALLGMGAPEADLRIIEEAMKGTVEELYAELFDSEVYGGMRRLYDTQERFDIACDLIDRMHGAGNKLASIAPKVFEALARDML